jgi:hypothetical protein
VTKLEVLRWRACEGIVKRAEFGNRYCGCGNCPRLVLTATGEAFQGDNQFNQELSKVV